MAPTFVLSTGRSGSTLISQMLRRHPEVLSVSELFSTVHGRYRPGDTPGGSDFWHLLSDPDPQIDAMVTAGLRPAELIYPYGTGRFDPAAGVPALCHMTLPMLTDDPDTLHDELAAEIAGWPQRPVAEQFAALFATLAARYDRGTVVERSGGSLAMLDDLRALFPDARFVYLTRDGAASALSMSRHAGFRLMLMGREAARLSGLAHAEDLGPEQFRALPPELARMLTDPGELPALMRRDLPLTAFGAMWAEMTREGTEGLLRLPAGSWMPLSYEDLLADPGTHLRRLAAFLDVPAPPQWLTGAADLADPGRRSALRDLDPRLAAALRRSCEPGTTADLAVRAAA